MDERAQRARAFAVNAHGDQKYGDEPYFVHLDEALTRANQIKGRTDSRFDN